jgi:hypothetical protein
LSHQPRLFTARYSNPSLATHPAAKVQTSLGAPKFKLPYHLGATIPELAPAGWMLNKSGAEFADLYTQLLERRGGIDHLAERFADVARAASVDQLVLLCFEDITKPGLFCHRRVFGTYWEQRTGQAVEELPEDEPGEQLRLV